MYLLLIISIHSILMLFSMYLMLKLLILPNQNKSKETKYILRLFGLNLKYLYSTGSGELLFLEYKNSSPFYLAGLFILFLPPNIYLIVPLLAPSFAYMPINGYGCRPTLAGRSRCSILRFSSLLFFIAYLVFTPEIFYKVPRSSLPRTADGSANCC